MKRVSLFTQQVEYDERDNLMVRRSSAVGYWDGEA